MTRIVGLLLAALILAGCQNGTQKEIEYGVDAEKATLLEQIEKKYENPQAHYELGKLYHADGLLRKAEFEYRVAIGFDPVHYRAQAATVKVWRDMKDAERAKMAARMYMDQAAVKPEASLRLGRAFQDEGMDDYALQCYQQAANLAPNSAVVFKQLGFYYLAKGDQVRAEDYLRRSFQLDPYQSEVAGELGRMGVMVQIPNKKVDDKVLKEAAEE